jgi:hypothetical protein
LYSTKRAFLEAIYAIYPTKYEADITALLRKETEPKLFAMQSLYLVRNNPSKGNVAWIHKEIESKFSFADTIPLLMELKKYLDNHTTFTQTKTPDIIQLFSHQRYTAQKTIYSFQRWNRDYPGVAIIQNSDGSFLKDTAGKLLVFQQLARSASDLPYFITNGSTPQGVFSIQGTEVARNNFIGPTPNIQLVMPFEADSIYWHTPYDSTKDALANYKRLFPPSWQQHEPMTEAFYAGKIGRSEIIAHGSTIDPDYFKGKPYYPLTPTLGCLCAKEEWNIFNGKILKSDQFELVNTFLSTEGDTGYLYVINLDNKTDPVSHAEVEDLVKKFEEKK